jgi:ADP-heptose:LPS heptosyltransferase
MKRLDQPIGVLMPNRLGDSILSLPFCLTLNHLLTANGQTGSLQLLIKNVFYPVYQGATFQKKQLCIQPVELKGKLKSWLSPYTILIHCANTSDYVGYRAGQHWGHPLANKPYQRFQKEVGFIELEGTRRHIAAEFLDVLTGEFQLSLAAASYFGFLLMLGFSKEEVFEALHFLRAETRFPRLSWAGLTSQNTSSPYVTICMEAGYGSQRTQNRCWDRQDYLKLAETLYRKHGVQSWILGLETNPPLPEEDYLVDLRSSKRGLGQVMRLLVGASAHIGNDSGLLHLAALLGTPTVGIYLATDPLIYGPVSVDKHRSLVQPEGISSVVAAFESLAREKSRK